MWGNTGQGNFDQGQSFGGGGSRGGMSPGGFGTQQQSQDKKFRARVQNLIPVTIAQILNSVQNEDKFLCDNFEISQVTFIGLVKSVRESPTRLDYEIDDMSGPSLEVKQFVDNDENAADEERVQPMRENTYVRVCGHVRSFGGKRNVVAFRMMPILDMNEMSCHILEVVHSHLRLTQAEQIQASTTAGAAQGTYNAPQVSNNFMTTSDNPNGLTPTQMTVQNTIKSMNSDQGCSIEDACAMLRHMPDKLVRETIEFLSSEGHIYSTIDEDHFKATDS